MINYRMFYQTCHKKKKIYSLHSNEMETGWTLSNCAACLCAARRFCDAASKNALTSSRASVQFSLPWRGRHSDWLFLRLKPTLFPIRVSEYCFGRWGTGSPTSWVQWQGGLWSALDCLLRFLWFHQWRRWCTVVTPEAAVASGARCFEFLTAAYVVLSRKSWSWHSRSWRLRKGGKRASADPVGTFA